jgi:hypothetical protein
LVCRFLATSTSDTVGQNRTGIHTENEKARSAAARTLTSQALPQEPMGRERQNGLSREWQSHPEEDNRFRQIAEG